MPEPKELLAMRIIEHWIAGKITASAAVRTAPVYNPATGQQSAEVVLGSREDVEAAIAAAREAFPGWSQSSVSW
jgi:malonate-semialdehyde dehydrogenase (acetylating)/methylmalonate-semialdehyde dehydrogenase